VAPSNPKQPPVMVVYLTGLLDRGIKLSEKERFDACLISFYLTGLLNIGIKLNRKKKVDVVGCLFDK
jgi:hypothetical protein